MRLSLSLLNHTKQTSRSNQLCQRKFRPGSANSPTMSCRNCEVASGRSSSPGTSPCIDVGQGSLNTNCSTFHCHHRINSYRLQGWNQSTDHTTGYQNKHGAHDRRQIHFGVFKKLGFDIVGDNKLLNPVHQS